MKAKGHCVTEHEYSPDDFTGWFTVFDGWLSAGDLRPGARMVWLTEPSALHDGAYLVFDDIEETNLPERETGLGWGYITREDAPGDLPEPPKPDPLPSPYVSQYGRQSDVHFLLGSATVRDEARELIRVFAAEELAAFQRSSSDLLIDGFADRLGAKYFNDALSKARAENTAQAFRDCLGNDLRAEIIARGHGERLLTWLGFPDRQGKPEWRRVFATLDGHSAIVLQIRDLRDVKQ